MFFCAASMTANRSRRSDQRLGGLGGLLLRAVADPLPGSASRSLRLQVGSFLGLEALGDGGLRG
jgi:hypothetical protein